VLSALSQPMRLVAQRLVTAAVTKHGSYFPVYPDAVSDGGKDRRLRAGGSLVADCTTWACGAFVVGVLTPGCHYQLITRDGDPYDAVIWLFDPVTGSQVAVTVPPGATEFRPAARPALPVGRGNRRLRLVGQRWVATLRSVRTHRHRRRPADLAGLTPAPSAALS
jgi:hypothetical protein